MNERFAKTLWAFALAVALVSAVETARVPARLFAARPPLVVDVLAAAWVYAVLLLWPALLIVALSALAPRFEARRVFIAVASATFSLGVGACLSVALGDVVEVPWYAGALLAVFSMVAATAAVPEAKLRGLGSGRRARIIARAALASFVVVGVVAESLLLPVGYPGLHYGLLLFVCLAATLASRPLVGSLRGRGPRLGLGLLVAAAATLTSTRSTGSEHLRRYAPLGAASLSFAKIETLPGPGGPPNVAGVRAIFGAPEFPEGFDIAALNVLLVTWEATGYRHTSLGGAPPEVTPNLAALAARSRTYARAYSPSSNTLQSMSSILALGLPSTVPLTTTHRRWRGRLGDDVVTAAEHFGRLGAHTLWVGHDYRRMFSRDDGIAGLDRGFQERRLVAGSHYPEVDRGVAERAIKRIGRLAGRRFFAWVHLTSPHYTYVPHGDAPDRSARALHQGEVRFADAQLGRLLEGLEAFGLSERTVIIVTADHGEEFGEHGGDAHGSTLYEEVVHVPLVVHVPGEAPRTIDDVTSNACVLPWLLTHPSSSARADVEAQIAARTAPVLEAASGAVVSELLGADRTQIALIWSDRKLIYDAHSGLVERFDLRVDPAELSPLPVGPARATMDAFLAIRARNARATVR